MTCSACASDVDGVEVSPIQQRAVLRDLHRALVDPEFDAVVLARATKDEQWMEGYESAVGCVDALIEHLTSHIEGLANAVPPVRSASTPAEGGERAAAARLRELAETCERVDVGDGVMETPLEAARQLGVDLRLILAALTRAAAPTAATEGEEDDEAGAAVHAVRAALARFERPDELLSGLESSGWRIVRTTYGKPAAKPGGGWTLTGDALYNAASGRVQVDLPAVVSAPLCDLFANLTYYREELAGSWHEAGEALARAVLRTHLAATPRSADEGAAGTGGA